MTSPQRSLLRSIPRSSRNLASIAALFFLVASATPGRAQTPCDLKLIEAERSYQAGNFEAVPKLLETCAKEARQQHARLYALLAKAYVVTDQTAEARRAVEDLLRFDSDYEPDGVRDPARFVRLVARVKREAFAVQVTSVSKTAESLREAPATVVVVTAEQIERRGYLDLEALLHDIPGFDHARTNGITYANSYQRGFRSDLTTRTLFLIDGVEHNELWGQIAYMSRQFALTNIERVEVIYGPASTMYGANAFLGVINVVTKQPEDFLEEGKAFGGGVQLNSGSWDTSYIDADVAGRTRDGNLSWSLSGRIYRSDEEDVSDFETWSYDPDFYDTVDYGSILGVTGQGGVQDFLNHLAVNGLANCTGQPGCLYAVNEAAGTVSLTPDGVARAAELDKVALTQILGGQPVGYSDTTKDWSLYGKLRIQRLELGFHMWHREEGLTRFYTHQSAAGSDNGMTWIPTNKSFYVKYDRSFRHNLSLSFFSLYKLHELIDGTVTSFANRYSVGNLGIKELVLGTESFHLPLYFNLSSNQLISELTLVYSRSDRFNLVSGLGFKSGTIQGNYVLSLEPHPRETGTPGLSPDALVGGNHYAQRDIAAFTQASYKARDDLKLVAGVRLDNNRVRDTLGYGTVFNYRLGLVYSPGDFVFKAIYATAFQDASNFEKYVTVPGVREFSNPNLQPENVENFELSADRRVSDNLSLDVSLYQATYSDILVLLQVPCVPPPGQEEKCPGPSTTDFRGAGTLEIRGVQANATYKYKSLSLYANYTFADPFNTRPLEVDGTPLLDETGNPVDKLRIADIASHQVNLGANLRFRERFNLNLRTNYVGPRKTGRGTTIPTNPFEEIDSYLVSNAALTYEGLLPGFKVQLIVNNLFDTEYFDPGVRDSNERLHAARAPQPSRSFFLRLSKSF